MYLLGAVVVCWIVVLGIAVACWVVVFGIAVVWWVVVLGIAVVCSVVVLGIGVVCWAVELGIAVDFRVVVLDKDAWEVPVEVAWTVLETVETFEVFIVLHWLDFVVVSVLHFGIGERHFLWCFFNGNCSILSSSVGENNLANNP